MRIFAIKSAPVFPCFIGVRLRTGFIFLILLFFISLERSSADTFSKFGIMRANIAHYCSDHRWLVCFETKRLPKGLPQTSEAIGFDAEGNLFRIRGELRPGAENLLSPESYEKPNIAFSTQEGYFYIWRMLDDEAPFESHLKVKEYDNLIEKFELYPLLKSSKDAPLSFVLLKENPDFYDHALALPRPKSVFRLENPTARRTKVGIFPAGRPNNRGFFVHSVVDTSAAAAAGIKPRDLITKLAINGMNFEMEKGFPLPDDLSVRILSLRVARKTDENRTSFFDVNIFPPSPLEYFLLGR